MSDTYLEDLALDPVMALPNAPLEEEELLEWAKEVHVVLQNSYVPQVDRVENMIMMDNQDGRRPDAKGSRRFFYNSHENKLYFDRKTGGKDSTVGEWILVGGTGTSGATSGVTGYCANPMPNNYYLQGLQLDDTISDLVGMSDADIATLGSVDVQTSILSSGIVSIADSDLTLDNNMFLWGDMVDTTPVRLLGVSDADLLTLGNTSIDLGILANADVWVDEAHVNLSHQKYIYGEETGGTYRAMLGMSGADIILGNATNTLGAYASDYINLNAGTQIRLSNETRLPNNTWLVARNNTDSADVDLLRLNATNHIELGSSSSGDILLDSSAGFDLILSDMDILLSNSFYIRGASGAGGEYLVIGIDGADDVIVGNVLMDMELKCSNQIKLTGGDLLQSGGDIILDDDTYKIIGEADTSVRYDMLFIDGADSNKLTMGDGGLNIKLDANNFVELGFGSIANSKLMGVRSSAGVPSSGTWTINNSWGIHWNTVGAVAYIVYRTTGGAVKYKSLDNT
jgi:hypothetical protein